MAPTARDHALEAEVLERAGGLPQYDQHLLARLDQFEHNDGGNVNGWEQPVDAILVEAQEEAVDVTGWLIGALLQLDPALRHRVFVVMKLAATLHRELEEVRRLLAATAFPGESSP